MASLLWMLAAALALVRSASITDIVSSIPSCALPCLMESLQVAECSLTDVTLVGDCVCRNTTLLSSMSVCTQTSCAFSDQVLTSQTEQSLCAPYPKESRTHDIQVAAIVTMAVAIPVVLARCAARLLSTKRLWLDDWIALAAMVILMGFGLHYWDTQVGNGALLLQLFYVAQILYIVIQVISKVSIVCLFIKVFPARWIRLTLKIFIAFMVGHGLIFIFVIVFQCWPIYSIWDKTVTGHCVDVTAVGFMGAGIGILEDLLLIVLPIVELRKLPVTLRQRLLLSVVLAIASFAIVTSLIRLKYLVTFANIFDSTWDNVDVIIWSLIELLTAVFLGSLPPLRLWIGRVIPFITITWSKPASDKPGLTPAKGDFSETKQDTQKTTHSRSRRLTIRTNPRGTTDNASFTMSAVSSIQRSGQWTEIPESPIIVPTSKFRDSEVAFPAPTYKEWLQQPDSKREYPY